MWVLRYALNSLKSFMVLKLLSSSFQYTGPIWQKARSPYPDFVLVMTSLQDGVDLGGRRIIKKVINSARQVVPCRVCT